MAVRKMIKDLPIGSFADIRDVGWVRIIGPHDEARRIVWAIICETGRKTGVSEGAYVLETGLSCPGIAVSRGPYSYTAKTSEEAKQIKEYLGIEPPGVDVITYVKALDDPGVHAWKDYWVKIFTDLKRMDIVEDVKLIHANILMEREIKEEVYKVLPKPDPRLHDEGIVLYKELDEALFKKDALEVIAVLRKMRDVEQSPIVVLGVVITMAGVIKAIIAVLGSVTFSKFLYEESLQTADFSLYGATGAKQWDLAQKALDNKKDILFRPLLDQILEWIPAVNIIAAVHQYWDISRKKWEIDQELVNREMRSVRPNYYVSIDKAADNISKGLPPDKYLPMPEEPVIEPVFKINIDSVPTRAKLYIDNVYTYHLTPSNEKELKDVMRLLTPGLHTIKVTKAGMMAEEEVEITTGDNGVIMLTLGVPGLVPAVVEVEIVPEVPPVVPPVEIPELPPRVEWTPEMKAMAKAILTDVKNETVGIQSLSAEELAALKLKYGVE